MDRSLKMQFCICFVQHTRSTSKRNPAERNFLFRILNWTKRIRITYFVTAFFSLILLGSSVWHRFDILRCHSLPNCGSKQCGKCDLFVCRTSRWAKSFEWFVMWTSSAPRRSNWEQTFFLHRHIIVHTAFDAPRHVTHSETSREQCSVHTFRQNKLDFTQCFVFDFTIRQCNRIIFTNQTLSQRQQCFRFLYLVDAIVSMVFDTWSNYNSIKLNLLYVSPVVRSNELQSNWMRRNTITHSLTHTKLMSLRLRDINCTIPNEHNEIDTRYACKQIHKYETMNTRCSWISAECTRRKFAPAKQINEN